jgi:hypothetical protein
MRDSGWDIIPPDVRFAGEPVKGEFHLGQPMALHYSRHLTEEALM